MTPSVMVVAVVVVPMIMVSVLVVTMVTVTSACPCRVCGDCPEQDERDAHQFYFFHLRLQSTELGLCPMAERGFFRESFCCRHADITHGPTIPLSCKIKNFTKNSQPPDRLEDKKLAS